MRCLRIVPAPLHVVGCAHRVILRVLLSCSQVHRLLQSRPQKVLCIQLDVAPPHVSLALANVQCFAHLPPAVVPRWRQSAATSVVAKFLEVCVRYIKAHSQLVAQFLHIPEERFFDLAVQSQIARLYAVLLVECENVETCHLADGRQQFPQCRASRFQAEEFSAQSCSPSVECFLDKVEVSWRAHSDDEGSQSQRCTSCSCIGDALDGFKSCLWAFHPSLYYSSLLCIAGDD